MGTLDIIRLVATICIQAYAQTVLDEQQTPLPPVLNAQAYVEQASPEAPIPPFEPPHFLTYAEHVGDLPAGFIGQEEESSG